MKYCFFLIAFLFLAGHHLHSQTITGLNVYGDINSRVTADEITVSDDGTTFYCSGNVKLEPFNPPDDNEYKPCGGSSGYVCGVLSMQSTGFDGVTTFICVGSSGRCLQISAQ